MNDIGTLKTSKYEVEDRIHRTDFEKTVLENTTQDEHNKVLDPVTYKNIKQQVKDLYAIVLGDKAEGKLNGAEPLPLLHEMEKVIDEYLGDFKRADNDNKDRVIREAKQIKKQIWAEKRDKDREEEKLLNIEK
jgi:hypothetical protein